VARPPIANVQLNSPLQPERNCWRARASSFPGSQRPGHRLRNLYLGCAKSFYTRHSPTYKLETGFCQLARTIGRFPPIKITSVDSPAATMALFGTGWRAPSPPTNPEESTGADPHPVANPEMPMDSSRPGPSRMGGNRCTVMSVGLFEMGAGDDDPLRHGHIRSI